MNSSLDDFDGLLLLGFGGPEKPDDVVPFLANVTAGANIPRERLAVVGQHYFGFGGRSPINAQAKALIAALHEEFRRRGHDLPIYWGNKFWEPFIPVALDEALSEGDTRLLVLTISAYPSWSGCRSYREALAEAAGELPFDFVRVGHYALDEGFLVANAEAVAEAMRTAGEDARLVFVTHSIPTAMNEASGPEGSKGAYLAWHRAVAPEVASRTGRSEYDLAFCSRSGPPHQPWLEPDVNDHLEQLAAEGVRRVVLAPIGFISDHMEVVYDLDTQARETCERLGIVMARAATAGTAPAFVRGLADRIERAAHRGAPEPNWCGVDCCPNLRQAGLAAVE